MTGFAALLAGAHGLDDGLTLDVPETWHQGRTAYGGFSSALALAVAQKVGGEGLPPLRSAQLAMMAPVNGRVEARARVERAGRNATWIAAEVHGAKGLAFTASFVFMGAVESALHINERPVPEGLVPCDEARAVTYTEHTPAFLANNFETRHAVPPVEDKRPEMCRWVRLAEGLGLDPMVAMLLIGDALPPGVMPMMHAAVPVSTMHWQVNLLTPAPATREGWWLLRSVGDYAEKGCSSQRMAIWNADGAPVMAGMQSVALFG
ncbi:acyl-CoA thioesterase [Novosphingobium mangrovi (ex Huang et al. 2023)]|uniref:Thioesterase family protein n=1 Tax=Novosphingobium mangrovi (ex Huang et al. 2023) TaxID=2976432 RepID=A0ABT2I851_9SPHN|nr:thioesterase family protein [Novosphingobium mangrovi (ex Huang et al. 2023)]MCT2400987.1 thioesterase family protein [Novosphingobium mangrovi (ex Huang et al. 2023)]